LFGVVRPLLRSVLDRPAGRTPIPHVQAVVFAGVLVSSAVTQWIGLDAIFGAFVFGLAVPRDGETHAKVVGFAGQIAYLLLPVYFVVTGLTVNLSGLGTDSLALLGLILAVAVGGKALGTYPAARLHGIPRRHSAVLAVLMNTRGLTELVILTIGLRAGLLDRTLYSLLVAMAVLTTVAAGPLLAWLYPRDRIVAERASATPVPKSDGAGDEHAVTEQRTHV
ncbi:cation:proton antiporter, partial [Streptosporangium algeriense]